MRRQLVHATALACTLLALVGCTTPEHRGHEPVDGARADLESDAESDAESGTVRDLEPRPMDERVARWVAELPEGFRVPPRVELPDESNAFAIWRRIPDEGLDVVTPLWARDDIDDEKA